MFKSTLSKIFAIAAVMIAGFSLSMGVTDARWTSTVATTQVPARGGFFNGTAKVNGTEIDLPLKTVNGLTTTSKWASQTLTLDSASAHNLVDQGKVTIPITLDIKVSGAFAVVPTIKIYSNNWNGKSTKIEPRWYIAQVSNASECETWKSAPANVNWTSGSKELSLNGTGGKNANGFLLSKATSITSRTYQLCLLGDITSVPITCEIPRDAIHTGYNKACGTYSNTATVQWNDPNSDTNKSSARATWTTNKVTQAYDWYDWLDAYPKTVTSLTQANAPYVIEIGYIVEPVVTAARPTAPTSSTLDNIPTTLFPALSSITSSYETAALPEDPVMFTGGKTGYIGTSPDNFTLNQGYKTWEVNNLPMLPYVQYLEKQPIVTNYTVTETDSQVNVLINNDLNINLVAAFSASYQAIKVDNDQSYSINKETGAVTVLSAGKNVFESDQPDGEYNIFANARAYENGPEFVDELTGVVSTEMMTRQGQINAFLRSIQLQFVDAADYNPTVTAPQYEIIAPEYEDPLRLIETMSNSGNVNATFPTPTYPDQEDLFQGLYWSDLIQTSSNMYTKTVSGNTINLSVKSMVDTYQDAFGISSVTLERTINYSINTDTWQVTKTSINKHMEDVVFSSPNEFTNSITVGEREALVDKYLANREAVIDAWVNSILEVDPN